MKILFITAEGFDTPNPNNQMAETMIRGFCEAGHSVHLIQSHRKGINPDIPVSLQSLDNLTCDTIVRKVVDKTSFVKRYLNDLHYAFQAKKRWKKIKDIDVIYLQSNPTIIYPMLLLRLYRRKTPIVYSIYDVFPGHAYDIGVIKNKLIYNILRIIQKPCYKMPSAIVVLGEDMKTKVVEQGAKEEKVFVVEAWYDVTNMREVPKNQNRFLVKYKIPSDKFYVQFAGTIGYVFNYNTIIELAKRLLHHNDIIIQIIGDGNVKEKFKNKAEEQGLVNIEFYPLQPVELVPDVYSACDVCIIPLQKGVIGNGIPSKAPLLMACHKVIINSVEDSCYSRMFEQHNMGISVNIEDYEALANAVLLLKDSPERLVEMGKNAYDFGMKNYASDKSIQKLLDIFESVKTKKDN
jgi:colanic acid biosynthesis glycosyl transferase WcaI